MTSKKLLGPTALTALLTIALVFLFIQFWGTPVNDVLNEITALAICGLLIISYLLRVALVFVGLYALYRILWEHANGQDYKQRLEV